MPGTLTNPSLSPIFSSPFTLLLSLNYLLLVLSLSFFFPCCYSINEQGQTLLAWKNSLNNTGGDALLASWSASDSSPCKWLGVGCNSKGEVEEISLKYMDLKGSLLPSNFQALKTLKVLVLSSTNITGPIPRELGDCEDLVSIDLSGNSLSGEIPEDICKLSKLESLSLHTNFLEGNIPSNIGNLSSLVNLTLYDNQLSGEIPKSFGSLRRLQVFRAGGNKNLKGELPWEIGNCTSLVMLGLAETSISGSLPSSIGMLRNIQTIAIYTTLLSGSIPKEIGNCSELQNLYLYQNSISGPIPSQLGNLRKLESLLLWQNNLAGTIPEELGSCTELKVIDFSVNLLTGSIPRSFGMLSNIEEIQLSVNQLTGVIPPEITNCTSLTQLEVDNNALSGEIPALIGNLRSLNLFFAWQNKLTGKIPESLSQCQDLESLDLSYNNLIGSIPKSLFGLKNLTKLLLISNELSGFVPPDIGNCTSLFRLRLNGNRFSGSIPHEIGNLNNLNFMDMSNNHFVGQIPPTLSQCENLQFIDLHSNSFTGPIPDALPKSLRLIDFSDNILTGPLTPTNIGSLTEVTKLNLGINQLSGEIPEEISSCSKLQLLDLGRNHFSGEIPKQLGQIPSLEISLNLSFNQLSGQIPSQISGLTNLGILDISHNNLSGNLNSLSNLQNLVSLNVSFNYFSGELPNTPFFKKLPLSDLAPNQGLFISSTGNLVDPTKPHATSAMKFIMSILLSITSLLILLTIYALLRSHIQNKTTFEDISSWEMTFYQKLDITSIDDVIKSMTSSNVIGTGSSGVVYRVTLPNNELAVKKMWSLEESGAFECEIKTLGSIRHKNIVRLLGWGCNKNVKLLFYDYLPNGSLSSMLHGSGKGGAEWEMRYEVVVGVAHALAYLHHDCVPPIIHGDVKAMNVLLDDRFQACLADFGLARIVDEKEDGNHDYHSKPLHKTYLAGSYGYMAPEHASMQRITEKSDVYSYGVVLLEVLTGKHPLDPTLPGGAHMVQWVRNHLANKGDPSDILDPKLRGRAEPAMHEMLQTLAVSFLCVSTKPEDRPTMKDIVAMLREIRAIGDNSRFLDSDELKKKAKSCLDASPYPLPSPKHLVSHQSSNVSFHFSDDSVYGNKSK